MKTLPMSLLALTALVAVTACDDDPTMAGPTGDISLNTASATFMEADPAVGSDETLRVSVMNDGEGDLAISSITLEGSDASSFAVVDGGSPTTLSAGAMLEVTVAFTPDGEGLQSAALVFESDSPGEDRVEVRLEGQATRFRYTQVDRIGIPALNTVFNHPSNVAGFDKTAYNTASPADDLATYQVQFETVLGAVGNPDPTGTALLLLPDALPVSLAAAPTSFATLTGRALSDDAVDVALSVTVGIASLQSDHVDANDKSFRTSFPYVAEPHN